MKEKIVHLMKSEGLTSSRLAEILETQPSRISHIVSGRNKPSFDLLQIILRRFPRINPDWLLLDSPQMYRSDESGSTTPFSSGDDPSMSIDLFGLGAESTMDNSSDFATSFGLVERGANEGQIDRKNGAISGGNFGGNLPQNSQQNIPQNSPQNMSQNGAQNRVNLGGVSPAVQRVIILYSDGTFRTYESR